MNSLRSFFLRIKNSNLVQNIELPHRSVLILAAVCISIVGIALTYRYKEAKMAESPYTNNISITAGTSNQVLAADERVANALAETQSDLLGALASSSNPFDPSPKDTLSDRFTKDVLAAYAKAQYSQDGTTNTDTTDLGVEALNNIDTSKLPQARYTIKNLTVFIPQNTAQIKDYANNFAKVYLSTIAPVGKNPNAYATNISLVGKLYYQISANLLKISVPNDLAVMHLQIVNDFSLMADTFPLIDGEEKDPVKALLGLSLVKNSLTEIPTLFIKMNQYFKQNGILFDKNEVGALWLQVPDKMPETSSIDSSSQIDLSQ